MFSRVKLRQNGHNISAAHQHDKYLPQRTQRPQRKKQHSPRRHGDAEKIKININTLPQRTQRNTGGHRGKSERKLMRNKNKENLRGKKNLTDGNTRERR